MVSFVISSPRLSLFFGCAEEKEGGRPSSINVVHGLSATAGPELDDDVMHCVVESAKGLSVASLDGSLALPMLLVADAAASLIRFCSSMAISLSNGVDK